MKSGAIEEYRNTICTICYVYEIFVYSVDEAEGWITISQGAPRGQHIVDVSVFDNVHQVTVTCSSTVNVMYLYEDAIMSSGSLRIIGIV